MKRIISLVVLLLVIWSSSAELPLPKGIDGMIYTLPELQPVPDGTRFEICNLANSYCVSGLTGNYAYSGRFSAALTGNDGDTIRITAEYNGYTVNRTVKLNGSMHNINLFIELDSKKVLPQLAPSPTKRAAESPSILAIPQDEQQKKVKRPNEIRILPSPKVFDPYVELSGVIFEREGKEVRSKTEIELYNPATGQLEKGRTGVGCSGCYYALIKAEPGQELTLRIKTKQSYHYRLIVNSSEIHKNITLNRLEGESQSRLRTGLIYLLENIFKPIIGLK